MSQDRTVGNAVALQQKKMGEVSTYLAQLTPIMAKTMPAHLNPERMARLALNSMRKTPALLDCTQVSLSGALLTAGALGLEVDNGGGEAYLVPYKDRKKNITEATLLVGYQGFSKLFYQHPLAAHLEAHRVFAGDEFDYEYGTAAFLRHKPTRDAKTRGDVIGFYAVATLVNGGRAFVFMDPDEVKLLRRGKVGPNGDIPDPQQWMERKTCVRQVMKLLPKSIMLNHALRVDEMAGGELHAYQIPKQIDEDRAELTDSAGESITTPTDADPTSGAVIDHPNSHWDAE